MIGIGIDSLLWNLRGTKQKTVKENEVEQSDNILIPSVAFILMQILWSYTEKVNLNLCCQRLMPKIHKPSPHRACFQFQNLISLQPWFERKDAPFLPLQVSLIRENILWTFANLFSQNLVIWQLMKGLWSLYRVSKINLMWLKLFTDILPSLLVMFQPLFLSGTYMCFGLKY